LEYVADLGILRGHGRRVIDRAVVDDNYAVSAACLAKDAFNGFLEKASLIKARDDDAYARVRLHGLRTPLSVVESYRCIIVKFAIFALQLRAPLNPALASMADLTGLKRQNDLMALCNCPASQSPFGT